MPAVELSQSEIEALRTALISQEKVLQSDEALFDKLTRHLTPAAPDRLPAEREQAENLKASGRWKSYVILIWYNQILTP